jgi:hypothetical protein
LRPLLSRHHVLRSYIRFHSTLGNWLHLDPCK